MFRTSRNDTNKTAYQETKGAFDWNATPLAPLGTKGMVYIHPDNRNTFAPHCDIGYVVARCPHHYRLLEFYIPETRGYRRSDTYRLMPQHCRMPTISEADRTVEAAASLLKEMKKEIPKQARGKMQWLKIIKKLQAALSNGESRVATQRPQRVATQGQTRVDGGVSTSTSPTCPRTLRNIKRVHQRKTRNNTPVNEATSTEPTPNGESPRQTQKINKGSSTAEPKGTAPQPRRSQRLATAPPPPLTARDARARTRTVNRQRIGSKRNQFKKSIKEAHRDAHPHPTRIGRGGTAVAGKPTNDGRNHAKKTKRTRIHLQFL